MFPSVADADAESPGGTTAILEEYVIMSKIEIKVVNQMLPTNLFVSFLHLNSLLILKFYGSRWLKTVHQFITTIQHTSIDSWRIICLKFKFVISFIQKIEIQIKAENQKRAKSGNEIAMKNNHN